MADLNFVLKSLDAVTSDVRIELTVPNCVPHCGILSQTGLARPLTMVLTVTEETAI